MNLIDILTEYAIAHDHSDELFLMLQDYTIDNRISRETLNRIIIKDLGTMRPITSYTEVYKMLVDTFFEKYEDNIKRLLDTLDIEYNPLQNKNITEIETIGETEQRESSGHINNTDSYTTNVDNVETGTDINEKQVSAFDATTYQNKDKNTDTRNLRTDNDTTHSGTTTSVITSDVDTDRDVTRNKTIAGKDGNDSMQDLIKEERRLAEFNIYNWIIEQMRKELFLLVY